MAYPPKTKSHPSTYANGKEGGTYSDSVINLENQREIERIQLKAAEGGSIGAVTSAVSDKEYKIQSRDGGVVLNSASIKASQSAGRTSYWTS